MSETAAGRYWTGVAGYVVVLLSAQSVMGLGIDKFKELWGLQALEVLAYTIVGAGAALVLLFGARAWSRCSAFERLWILAALGVYGAGTIGARNPQERLHYLGYGVLAALLFTGLFRRQTTGADPETPPSNTAAAAALAFVGGTGVGFLDELLQILWPRRYFDWADVAINALAVGLGLLVAIPVTRALQRRGGQARRGSRAA